MRLLRGLWYSQSLTESFSGNQNITFMTWRSEHWNSDSHSYSYTLWIWGYNMVTLPNQHHCGSNLSLDSTHLSLKATTLLIMLNFKPWKKCKLESYIKIQPPQSWMGKLAVDTRTVFCTRTVNMFISDVNLGTLRWRSLGLDSDLEQAPSGHYRNCSFHIGFRFQPQRSEHELDHSSLSGEF